MKFKCPNFGRENGRRSNIISSFDDFFFYFSKVYAVRTAKPIRSVYKIGAIAEINIRKIFDNSLSRNFHLETRERCGWCEVGEAE